MGRGGGLRIITGGVMGRGGGLRIVTAEGVTFNGDVRFCELDCENEIGMMMKIDSNNSMIFISNLSSRISHLIDINLTLCI
jgi:hypothetical protein